MEFSNTDLYSIKDVALLVGYSMMSDCFYPLDKNLNTSKFFLRESNLFQVMVFHISIHCCYFHVLIKSKREKPLQEDKININFQYGIDDLPPDLLKLNKSFINKYLLSKSARLLDSDSRYRINSQIGYPLDFNFHTIITGWTQADYSYEETGYNLCAETQELAVTYSTEKYRNVGIIQTEATDTDERREGYFVRNVNEIPSSFVFCIK